MATLNKIRLFLFFKKEEENIIGYNLVAIDSKRKKLDGRKHSNIFSLVILYLGAVVQVEKLGGGVI